jgi:hypothetical protein
MRGILLDINNEIRINKRIDSEGKVLGFIVGDTLLQNASLVLGMNQGELKEDPVVGASLLKRIRSKSDQSQIKRIIEISLARIGISFNDIEKLVQLQINKE